MAYKIELDRDKLQKEKSNLRKEKIKIEEEIRKYSRIPKEKIRTKKPSKY